METCTSDVLVGVKEVAKFIFERVDQGVVGTVEEKSLMMMGMLMIVMDMSMIVMMRARVNNGWCAQ